MGQPYDENEGYLYLVTLLGIASECSLQRIVHHDDGSSSLPSDSVAFLTLHGNIDLGDVFQPRVEMVGGKEHETFPTIT